MILVATFPWDAIREWVVSLVGLGLGAALLWGQLRIVASLRRQEEVLSEAKASKDADLASLGKTIAAWVEGQEKTWLHLQRLPETVKSLHTEAEAITEGLRRWTKGLEVSAEKSLSLAQTTEGALEPILHTERLLGERIVSLTRQHQTLQDTLERIEGHEARLPEQIAEVIRLSLRPAHQLLQRTQQSLLHLLEQHLASQHQERERWRESLTSLTERFSSLDRLLQTHERFVREVSLLQTTLTEMVAQIRIRPLASLRNDPNEPEILDQEIDRILQGIEDLRRPRS